MGPLDSHGDTAATEKKPHVNPLRSEIDVESDGGVEFLGSKMVVVVRFGLICLFNLTFMTSILCRII